MKKTDLLFSQSSQLIMALGNLTTPKFPFLFRDLSETDGVENILSPVRATCSDGVSTCRHKKMADTEFVE